MTLSLGTIVFSAAALLIALITILAIRSGQVICYPAFIQANRSERPGLFWMIIALQTVVVAAFAWLALA
ncbi:hypothetical protein [Pseudoxanthomonas yeongjuensis]|jgi:hypothetical protein|uniref:hypothetical protein n=1 Tax=Pseudoxanthomonas yeongjuensis TaxID=377616 RepID=UPI001B867C4B|nr:hypothetical protein [Pseudoxanthomonas yeongjuensis]